jgi:hypothetical protein
MMAEKNDFLKTPVWYPILAAHTFLTSFVRLRPEAVTALAMGEIVGGKSHPEVEAAIESLRQPMSVIPGNCFVSVDTCAPTDTERFESKGGAVYSARSAVNNLLQSKKVAAAAQRGDVEYICIRPYRNITQAREFRLFIYEGKLSAMSQYHLIRHFRRLEGVKEDYWNMAARFVDDIAWKLPQKTVVMDIYITSGQEILIVDFNPWGGDTDPLMLFSWERDWSEPAGIQLMAPPTAVSGDVKVSF